MGLIPIQSNLEGRTYALYKLEEIMKPLGYSIGGSGIMIKDASITKLMKKMGINFRVPFTAIDGELDVPGVIVRLGTPYILSHVYQDELDDNVNTLTAGTSGMDQFAEPKDPDGDVKRKYINIGKVLMQELERHFTNGE